MAEHLKEGSGKVDTDNKTFNLYKDKAINAVLCQASVAGALLMATATFALGYDRGYVYFILLVGIGFLLYYEFRYREYQRNYLAILILHLIKQLQLEGEKHDLVEKLYMNVLISKDTIDLTIDDLVERKYLDSTITIHPNT